MMLLTINGGKCQGNIIECGIWIANNGTHVMKDWAFSRANNYREWSDEGGLS